MSSEKCYSPAYQVPNEMYSGKRGNIINETYMLNHKSLTTVSCPSGQPKNVSSHVDGCITDCMTLPSIIGGIDDVSVLTEEHGNSHADVLNKEPAISPIQSAIDFGLTFQDEHCEELEHNQCHKSSEVVSDDLDGGSNPCEGEKIEDGENDEMLGIFAFSEEG